MPDDDELLASINAGDNTGDDSTSEPEEKPKKKKASKNEKVIKADDQHDRLDPRDEFIAILQDIGIRRGVGVITDVFYQGDISNPEWLDECLAIGGIAIPQRRLIITRYYGQSPEDLGVEMVSTAQSKKSGVGSRGKVDDNDIGATATEMLKERMRMSQTKLMIKQLDDMSDDGKKDLPTKTIERPLVDSETGEFIVKDGKPVMERITTVGGEPVSTSDPMTMMVAMANIFGKKSESDDRPSWAVELQNSVVASQAENDKRKLEDDLRRERDKREDENKEHQREMERMKDDMQREVAHIKDGHVEEMKRISDELTFRMENIKDNFGSELRHRDEMDSIKDVYGTEFGKLRDEIDTMQKDVKSAVVGEAVKTGSKVVGKSTDTIDTVVGGAAEVFKDMYKAQIESMRGSIGGGNISVPDTTEKELERLI